MTENTSSLLNDAKQALMQSRFSDAINLCERICALPDTHSHHKDALYLKAVAQRLNRQIGQALTTLTALLDRYPDYGRGYQEQGYCFKQCGEERNMASAFYRATRFNPALLPAWRELEGFYQRNKQSQALTLAKQHIAHLASLPKPLLGALDLMHDGQVHKAEKVCRDFLKQHKHHPDAMMLLAEIGLKLKVYHDAEFLLESCVALYPDNDAAATAYQSMLGKLGKYPQGVALARRRLAKNKDSVAIQGALANALVGLGELDEAVALYRTIIKKQPSHIALRVQLGHALKAKGDSAEAIDAYEQAVALEPDYGDAYWSLANTKTYLFDESMIAQMKHYESAQTTSLDAQIHLCFALGKAYEDHQDHASSFHYYEKGNGLKHRTQQFDIKRTEQAIQAQKDACTQKMFTHKLGCQAQDPIFIVGLPRAGSTLLEQILASHSQVDGTMELHDILSIASSLSNQSVPYPFNLASLSDETCAALGKQYIEQTKAYRGSAPFFIDKMPNNFIHIGLIKRILPNAKIIDARRDPKACCFSGFKQLFFDGQEFSYSLTDIGRYYNSYVSLMEHWHNLFPQQILTVQHEAVIDDLEGQVRRILDYCQLPFEPACLAFYNTRRVIKTPSSEQVRQPIYRSGMTQWEGYKPFLGPLLTIIDNNEST
ncbi:tetratricopeptide repeat-containing sulfotransferase family protein [Alteromonas sp. C1M14]|uniref:tetratricopeptide repeat-containing sulfotransferase family protein n=1 Tax=Alteromonas sp. C1M14 TaxID=2841567 RepID=UPI001C09B1CD|nr:tetratricopeptide repeat-containing sulfotransferase family protein [Alteromonas sp. C1M14]MBU2977077.1 sulfotransferase [Alteromonas sp. C1M14]